MWKGKTVIGKSYYDWYLDQLRSATKEDKMLRQEVIIASAPAIAIPETEQQRSHLIKGLRKARDKQLDSLERKHGLQDDESPKSFKEFIARVKAGNIMYSGREDEDHEHGCGPMYYIRWRNPKTKEDKAGFKAAAAELRTRYDAAKDEIIILPLEQGLAAKRAFEGASTQE